MIRRGRNPPTRGNDDEGDASDVDGAVAERVASVTLESDNLSETAPRSTRSKRRRRLMKKPAEGSSPKEQHLRMDVDKAEGSPEVPLKNSCVVRVAGLAVEDPRLGMDWESARPYAETDISSNADSCSSLSGGDADDEQSDWPSLSDRDHVPRSSTHPLTTSLHLPLPSPNRVHADVATPHSSLFQSSFLAPPLPSSKGATSLHTTAVKKIERFLADPQKKELTLNHVYQTSLVKKVLTRTAHPIQILKRGRGTVVLKKS